MTRKRRFIAMIIALTFAAAMLFSAVFVVVEADHDCAGEHCSVCHQINVCRNTLRQLSLGAAAIAPAAALTYILMRSATPAFDLHIPSTLITLKVKLTD